MLTAASQRVWEQAGCEEAEDLACCPVSLQPCICLLVTVSPKPTQMQPEASSRAHGVWRHQPRGHAVCETVPKVKFVFKNVKLLDQIVGNISVVL